jgi:hypothetical protein
VQVRPNCTTPSSRAAKTSRKVWQFTEVDKVAGSRGSAGGLISVRRSNRRRSVMTVTVVLGRPLVAMHSS